MTRVPSLAIFAHGHSYPPCRQAPQNAQQGRSPRPLPRDAPLPAPGRQGDPAQAAEQDLLPDLRRRPRGGAGGRRPWCSSPAYDWFYPYYRDRALCLGLGMTPTEMLLSAVGAADDPNSGGRQMPSHWGHKELNIVYAVEPDRHAVPAGGRAAPRPGCATAGSRRSPTARPACTATRSCYCSSGDGTTSEGEFWEALNTACNLKLPVRLPRRGQRLRHLGPGRGQHGRRLDLEARAPASPDLLHRGGGRLRSARVVRGDDARGRLLPRAQGPGAGARARDPPVLALALRRRGACTGRRPSARPTRQRDPIAPFPQRLRRGGHRDRGGARGDPRRGRRARSRSPPTTALASPQPAPDTRLPATSIRPTSIPTSRAVRHRGRSAVHAASRRRWWTCSTPACKDEMARDPRILVFGEDVADVSREEHLGKVKGKGGVFKVTWGLQKRVRRRPRVQLAAGRGEHRRAARSAWRPAASSRWSRSSSSTTSGPRTCSSATSWRLMRWRSNNAFSRAGRRPGRPTAATSRAARSTTRRPARRCSRTCPACGSCARPPRSTPTACCARRSAATIRCIFLEHKHLYRQTYNKAPYPGPELHDPVRQGEGRAARERTLTVVTYGAMVQRALVAAKEVAEATGVSVEVIDLRSLSPVDWETIYQLGAEDQPGHRRVRGFAVVGLRRRDRGAHRRRAVRVARRAGAARGAPPTPSWPTRPSSRTRSCRRSSTFAPRCLSSRHSSAAPGLPPYTYRRRSIASADSSSRSAARSWSNRSSRSCTLSIRLAAPLNSTAIRPRCIMITRSP